MPDNNRFIDLNRGEANLELVVSFICPETKKSYVVVSNRNKIFDKSSKYENLDVFEINSHTGNNIVLKNVESSEWNTVKNFFFKEICGRIQTGTVY